MKKLTGEQIRNMWLDFFKSKGHHIEPGSSLIPKNDPTLLWINAGVAALKKYFDGSEIPPSRRIANAQKSIRTNDIEMVGKTDRHHTFFEMLGNFSIGDYFRKEAITWAVELLTSEKYFAMDKDKLYMTYQPSDLESKKIWMENGIKEDHLIPLEGNFWEIGQGPCGPNTEIFYDRGEKYDSKKLGIDLLKNDIENDRYIEIWNIVFSQYNAEPNKKRSEYKELPSKNIDTGAGLERFACVIQGTDSNFETDLFWPLILEVSKLTQKKYEDNKMAFRVISDHIRSVTFALADGENFSNEGRGYVLRRLIRRAERYGRVLGLNKPFLYLLVNTVKDIMKGFYPYLNDKVETISKMVKSEEEKFIRTLANGEGVLKNMIKDKKSLSGADMFKLYDTFGFPKELTMEICEENNVSYDLKEFEKQMNLQKERAREARGNLESMNKQSEDLLKFNKPSTFHYDKEIIESEIIGLFIDGKEVESFNTSGDIIVKDTPFYAESGGQISDIGEIKGNNFLAKVAHTRKAPNKEHLHHVEVLFGEVTLGDKVTLKIDSLRRNNIRRNHSSVHLLQAALSEVLGNHISQHGSFVSDEYIHFDFNHHSKMTLEEISLVESKVNKWINESIPQITKVLNIEEAKKIGARALFDEKYGDIVRVVTFGEISKEFCGGTHVNNTSDIGIFAIQFEESIASGIRRIEAKTSYSAYELFKRRELVLNNTMKALGVNSINDVNSKLNATLLEKNAFRKQIETLNSKLGTLTSKEIFSSLKENSKGIKTLVYSSKTNRNGLLSIIDNLKSNLKDYAIILIGEEENSLPIVVNVSGEGLKYYQANKLVKEIAAILEGSGGGRNDLASGAGKNKNKINEAINLSKELIK